MGERRLPFGPGKTSPRLVKDLLDYDPRKREHRGGKNLLADQAEKEIDDETTFVRRGENDCRHKLKKNSDRCVSPETKDVLPDASSYFVVSTICVECHYYFDILVDYKGWKAGQTPCKLSDKDNPLHHFQLVDTIYAKDQPERLSTPKSKYNPIIEEHHFCCSQTNCPIHVQINISAPRLKINLLAPILDSFKVRERGLRQIQHEPNRFVGLEPVSPFQALGFLRQYVSDAKNAQLMDTLPRKIAKRNKKFALSFGSECEELFEYLEFETVIEDPDVEEGEPNHFWQQPTITNETRAFFEDITNEITIQLSLRPLAEKQTSKTNFTYAPVPADRSIQIVLGYLDYPTRSRIVEIDSDEPDHPHYISLGADRNFRDDYLSWAYDRQCVCDPSNTPYYLDCLSSIAQGRESSDLQTKVVMITSAGEYGLRAIHDSYRFFGLDPNTKEGDDHIIGVYRSRIESAPRQKEEARNSLLAIAKSRDSEKIRAVANDRTMTLEEALEFFNAPATIDSDSLEAVAVSMSFDGDSQKVARALRVVANARGDPALSRAAINMESGSGSTLDVGEAYNRLQIVARHVPDETVLSYYQALLDGAGQGSKDSFAEALRVIALDRESNFLLSKLDDPNAVVPTQPSTASQPVGLDNIGNTCYLNSLLQYYYTVVPVRNVVMDFQNYRMTLNDEDIKKKRVGGRIVAKSEIIKAQKFVDELHGLFEKLKTASTRSVKPTRELAELTIFSSAAEANFRRASISSPGGPPNLASILNSPVYGPQLPPATIPAPPASVEDDVEMIDHPGNKAMSDDSSEATLVDMAEPLPSYEESTLSEEPKSLRDEKKLLDPIGLNEDAIMVNGDHAIGETTKFKPPPEKQPPLPPRNKAGLVIQTNDKKTSISDDELWKFGSQQDVTEVIGNVNFRLLCALKPTSIDQQSGEQMDIVRDTLYGANAVYLQKAATLEKKVEAWANLIVFPDFNGPRDIYEALDIVFDEQIVDIDNSTAAQYASISQLPPIIHIQIQRTAYDPVRQIASKNRNAVTFPETIYLDRYMDSSDLDSTLMRRRRETWKWKAQLRVLEARQAALNTTIADVSVKDALIATREYVDKLQEEEIDGVLVDADLAESLEERTMEVTEEIDSITKEIAHLKQALNEQFTDMRQHEYKLQAVFIHRGEAGGGHYWVYIYDFENDIWREYNDEYVTEVRDRRRIFEHQGAMGGTPYYLAYVRSADRKELVEAVCREMPEVQNIDLMDLSQGENTNMSTTGRDFMSLDDDDDDEKGGARHIEHARPRPIRPKPSLSAIAAWDDHQQVGKTGLDANGRPW